MSYLKHRDLFVNNTLTEKQAALSDDLSKKWHIVSIEPNTVTLSNCQTHEPLHLTATQFNHRQQYHYKTPAEFMFNPVTPTAEHFEQAHSLGYIDNDDEIATKCPHCQSRTIKRRQNASSCGNCGESLTTSSINDIVRTLVRMHII